MGEIEMGTLLHGTMFATVTLVKEKRGLTAQGIVCNGNIGEIEMGTLLHRALFATVTLVQQQY